MKIRYIFISLAVLIIVSAGFCAGFFEYKYTNKFYPGVTIAEELVGGKTYNEVLQEFKLKADTLNNSGINLVFAKKDSTKKINIPASSTGITADIMVEYFSIGDINATISDAYNYGRKGNIIQRIKEQYGAFYGINFDSIISLHKEAIQSLLARELKYFLEPAEPAYFSLDDNNKVIITKEKLGDSVDTENVVDSITQKLAVFNIEPITFKVLAGKPYPTQEKLDLFLDLAQEFSQSANVNFYYQNKVWKVNGKTLVTWLTLKSDYQMTIDSKKLRTFLSRSIATLIDNPMENSRFEIKDGALIEISPGKSGNAVDIDKAISQIQKIIPQIQQSFSSTGSILSTLSAIAGISSTLGLEDSKIQPDPEKNTIDVPIEVITTEPEITQKTIDQYKIKDLIGTAETNFTGGSADRQHNIEVGVSKLDGILIAPGEEFSTVWNIGDISEEAGFVKEYVIKGDQTVKELGGGLCQVATTLFRTAINAGLPITERVNHAYVIPYYGAGLDATIYGPHPDFKFVNDTGNYVLLQGKAVNDKVTFELYGILDGRTVDISKPNLYNPQPVPPTRNILTNTLPAGKISCQTSTHKGITADVTYTVTYSNNTIKKTVFHSVYEPWPKVCLIGTL